MDAVAIDRSMAWHGMAWAARKTPALTRPPTQNKQTKQNGTVFKVRYGSGTVQGFFAQDDMDVAGFHVKNQSFAEVTDASGLGRTYQVREKEGGRWLWLVCLGGWLVWGGERMGTVVAVVVVGY